MAEMESKFDVGGAFKGLNVNQIKRNIGNLSKSVTGQETGVITSAGGDGGPDFSSISQQAQDELASAAAGLGGIRDIRDPKATASDLQRGLKRIPKIRNQSVSTDLLAARGGLGRASGDVQRLRGLGTQGLEQFAAPQLAAQRQRTASQIDAARAGADASAAQRQAQLAASGVSGAAAERLGRGSNRDALLAQQRARQVGSQAEADILSASRGQQLGLLQGLSGQEAQLAGQQRGLGQLVLSSDIARGQQGLAQESLLQSGRQFDVGSQLRADLGGGQLDLGQRGQDIGLATTQAQLGVAPILASAIGGTGGGKGK